MVGGLFFGKMIIFLFCFVFFLLEVFRAFFGIIYNYIFLAEFFKSDFFLTKKIKVIGEGRRGRDCSMCVF